MLIRWVFAALHLLTLAIGFGAIWTRARAFDGPLDAPSLKRLFAADSWWGIAAILWIATGLIRAFGGLEKGSYYYVHNWLFRAKMLCLALILILEVAPMIALIRWRMQVGRGEPPDTQQAKRFARVSYAEAALVVLMVIAATGMARGWGR
jgi:putative membrane protein